MPVSVAVLQPDMATRRRASGKKKAHTDDADPNTQTPSSSNSSSRDSRGQEAAQKQIQAEANSSGRLLQVRELYGEQRTAYQLTLGTAHTKAASRVSLVDASSSRWPVSYTHLTLPTKRIV